MEIFAATAAMTLATVAAPASAIVFAPAPTTSTFNFRGTCIDCEGFGVGRLVLQNYSYGSSINSNNFVSFHYDGTNLQTPFTITAPNQLGGSISGAGPAANFVYVSDGLHFFLSDRSGDWQLGPGGLVADYGIAGAYTLATGAVPEAATWAMMIVGVGFAGSALRRRTVRATVRFA